MHMYVLILLFTMMLMRPTIRVRGYIPITDLPMDLVLRPPVLLLGPPHRPHCNCASKVSDFNFSCLTDASRFDCGSCMSTAQLRNSVEALGALVGGSGDTGKSVCPGLA